MLQFFQVPRGVRWVRRLHPGGDRLHAQSLEADHLFRRPLPGILRLRRSRAGNYAGGTRTPGKTLSQPQALPFHLEALNLDVWESETPAIPIVLGEKEKVYYFWKALLEKGVYTIISIAPGVPPGKDLIRTAISAAHTDEDLDRIEEAMAYAKSKI